MRIIAWNCRALGNGPAVRGLLDLQKREDPDILFLSETKSDEKRMKHIRWLLGMKHMVVKECRGKSGGLALFWKEGIPVELHTKASLVKNIFAGLALSLSMVRSDSPPA